MARVVGAAFLAAFATPALAAGDGFDGAPWIKAFYLGGMIALFGFLALGFGFLALGFGFLLGSFSKLSVAILVVLLVFLVLPIYIYLTLDLGRTIAVAEAQALMLLIFSPAIACGWWLGRKDAARRSNRNLELSAGSSHG
jgi:hypothetical protein